MKNYRPLPDCLTIAMSGINGLGLFALEDIPRGREMGITHHYLWEEIARTPLGGFINHSDDPNCRLERVVATSILHTTKDIKEGDELTLEYKMYEVENYNRSIK